MRHVANVWSKDAKLADTGEVVSGQLVARIEYNDITQELRETFDGTIWRNEYGDDITYRDRDGASGGDYAARVLYYIDLGYLVLTEDNLPE